MEDTKLTALHDSLASGEKSRGNRGGLGKGGTGFRLGLAGVPKLERDPKMPFIRFVPAGTDLSLRNHKTFGTEEEETSETSKKRKRGNSLDSDVVDEVPKKKVMKKLLKKVFKSEGASEMKLKKVRKALKKEHETVLSLDSLKAGIQPLKKFQVDGKMVKKL